METALTTMNQLLASLKQQTSAAFGNNGSGNEGGRGLGKEELGPGV